MLKLTISHTVIIVKFTVGKMVGLLHSLIKRLFRARLGRED